MAPLLIWATLSFWPTARAHAICNGQAPPSADFAFVVALYDITQVCGGTVLPGGWVLTAAHCGNVAEVVRLHPGAPIPASLGQVPAADRLGVARCVRHPAYDRPTRANDLALIQIQQLPADMKPATPVPPGWTEGGNNLDIVGSGCASTNQPALLSAAVAPIGTMQCSKAFTGLPSAVLADTICTAVDQSRVDFIDSGSPVLTTEGQLAGVVSTGHGAHNAPDRHVRLTAAYRDWIKKVKTGDATASRCPCGLTHCDPVVAGQ